MGPLPSLRRSAAVLAGVLSLALLAPGTVDVLAAPSPSAVAVVRVNQVGYPIGLAKRAYLMSSVDAYVVPFDYADYTPNPVATLNTAVTNLTGQPCALVPHGFNEKGNPTSLTFVGRVFGEAPLLALAKRYQDATKWHLQHPVL